MRTLPNSVVAALVLFMVLTALPAHADAQQWSRPLFVALPETFPNVDARVVILREPGREIVLLNPAYATADELGTALALLPQIQRERGNPRGGQMIPVVGFAPGPDLSPQRRAQLEEVIRRLRARPLTTIGSVGSGRWMPFDSRR